MPTIVTKTVKASGGDYSSLVSYEAGEQANLVSLDQIRQAECYAFVDEYAAAEFCAFDGWTTDATHYIRIYAVEQHTCRHGTGYRALISGFGHAITVMENFMRIEGIAAASQNVAGFGDRFNHIEVTGAGEVQISKCWSAAQFNDQAQIYLGNENASLVGKAWNNMGGPVLGIGGAWNGYTFGPTPGTWYLYNNTFVGDQVVDFLGLITSAGGTFVLKNNICDRGSNPSGAALAYSLSGAISGNNNLSDDTSAPGTSPVHNAQPAYEGKSAGNLHLSTFDRSGAKGGGANLSRDSNIPFTDDIDGNGRTRWDIGADEFRAQFTAARVSMPLNYGGSRRRPFVGSQMIWSNEPVGDTKIVLPSDTVEVLDPNCTEINAF